MTDTTAENHEHCVSGHIATETPTGTVGKLGGLDCYFAKPHHLIHQTHNAVLVIHDIFGWALPNTRLIADAVARDTGALAVVPDFFQGDSVNHEALKTLIDSPDPAAPTGFMDKVSNFGSKVAAGTSIAVQIVPFMIRHSAAKKNPLIDAVLVDLKTNHNITKIGGIGYCWGGYYTIVLAGNGKIDYGMSAHPAKPSTEELYGITKPFLFICAEEDNQFPQKTAKEAEEFYSKKPDAQVTFKYYPGTVHGFASRGDPHKPVVLQAQKDALAETINFIKAHL